MPDTTSVDDGAASPNRHYHRRFSSCLTAPPAIAPLTRAQRAHWRVSWEQRLAGSACSSRVREIDIHLFGIPVPLASSLGLVQEEPEIIPSSVRLFAGSFSYALMRLLTTRFASLCPLLPRFPSVFPTSASYSFAPAPTLSGLRLYLVFLPILSSLHNSWG
jgi:hypothetical protein